jgi:hypothetical protein
MKDFGYYNKPTAEYPDTYAYKKQLRAEIDALEMTAEERRKAIDGIGKKARAWFDVAAKPYLDEQSRLDAEFWDDCRKELKYREFLNPKACDAIETKAWDDGHAHGYSEVYLCLCDLIALARKIIA